MNLKPILEKWGSLIIFIFLFFICPAQSHFKNDTSFVLRIFLKNGKGRTIYLTNYDSGKIIDSNEIRNNSIYFKGNIKYPSYFKLSVNGSDGWYTFILADTQITIRGDADSIWNSEIYGSKENDIRKLFENEVAPYNTRLNYWGYKRDSAKEKGDSVMYHYFKEKNQKVFDSIFRVEYASLIRSYPKAFISLSILYNYYQFFPDSLRKILYDNLSIKLRASPLGKALMQKLLLTNTIKWNEPAPGFFSKDTSGRVIKLTDFRGKYVILIFWASWCGPCRLESPQLVELYNHINKHQITFIGVSLDTEKDAWEGAIEKDHLPWTEVSDLSQWSCGACRSYGITSIPKTFIIGPKGKILGEFDNVEGLESRLKELKL